MNKCKMIFTRSASGLQDVVNQMMDLGYVPFGSPSMNDGYFLQGMILPEPASTPAASTPEASTEPASKPAGMGSITEAEIRILVSRSVNMADIRYDAEVQVDVPGRKSVMFTKRSDTINALILNGPDMTSAVLSEIFQEMMYRISGDVSKALKIG